MLDRRRFNSLLLQAPALGLLSGWVSAEEGIDMPDTGVQLYSVREQLAKEPERCFRELADIGYRHAEWFDILTLDRLGPMASDYGLAISSCHVLSPFITGDRDTLLTFGPAAEEFTNHETLLDLLAKFGVKYLALGYLLPQERQTLDQYRSLSDALNRLGEQSRQRGIRLAYHNHEFELQPLEGERPLDLLVRELQPSLVAFELDVFWARFAGLDPAVLIRQLGHRCALLHLKDLRLPEFGLLPEQASPELFVELGQGVIDFPSVLQAAREVGVQDYYIEQDWATGDPLQSLGMSLAYLRSIQ